MTVSITDKKIALIAANGFDENHMTAIQRSLTQAQLGYKVIAPEQGLVNGWQDNAWGHYFTVDASINTALGSDYDALILIGGERSITKLKQNLHTKRIINHFIDAEKPLCAIGDSVALIALATNCANRTVATSHAIEADIKNASMICGPEKMECDGNLLTSNGEDIAAWVAKTVEMISSCEVLRDDDEAAAA